MAATTDITINNNSASAKVFTPSVQLPKGYQYRETSSTADAPQTLDVLHELPTTGSSSNAKHTIAFRRVRANSASKLKTGYASLIISVPPDGLTAADVSDLVAFVRNFMTDANLQKLLLGGF